MPAGDRLSLLGSSTLHEPGGLLFEHENALQQLLADVARIGPPVLVHRVPAESPLCRPGMSLIGWRAMRLMRMTSPSLAVPIEQSWNDYVGGLSRRITENLPRLSRKAARAVGVVTSKVIRPAVADVPEVISTLVKLESSGWKGRERSALLHRPALHRFFLEYCRRAARRGRLRVATLGFGDAVAAIEIAVEAYERVWQLKIGFDDAVAAYYPGLQLTAASIRTAFEDGLRSYEFLGSAEPWEERWNPIRRRYALVAIYPFGVRGIAGAAQDVAGAVARRAGRVQATGHPPVELA
jgi:CelD/BcsL family acetyltransferase involved in cellulose biosynthesis